MTQEDPLKPYRSRRDLSRTPEPEGAKPRPRSEKARFVVHKHQARTLHYDLRLEVGGVLKSWAVPKGPSTDPRIKRLAVPTEDHPLEYIDFEGAIPEGEYGAGATIAWDTGTYRNITEKDGKPVNMDTAIAIGHISVWLEGEKLRGGFALKRFSTGKRDQWLLVKMKDEQADPDNDPVTSQPQSVFTGRTIEEVSKEIRAEETGKKKKGKSSKRVDSPS
jgi:DNA ligase D-like protein (predicted 3'-phosphoesterase)